MWVCLLLVIIRVIMQHGNVEQINCTRKLWAHVQLIRGTQFQ